MTTHTLRKGESRVEIGFRPHDLGLTVDLGWYSYKPEFRLLAELKTRTDMAGIPEFWACDGLCVFFDKPAAKDYQVTAE